MLAAFDIRLGTILKFNFWANPGLIKLTTVHSFKGWEVHTLFLLIGMEDEQSEVGSFTSNELIYTAITRCRCNLCVINVNNEKYHEFFLSLSFRHPS